MKANRSLRAFSLAAVFLFLATTAAPLTGAERQVTVMTRNLYVGADVGAAVAAISSGDAATIVATVSEVWAKVRFTDFPARAEGIAREIEKARPDLIGLQEAELWRSQTPADFVIGNAERVEYDFVEILLHALRTRGLHYEVAAEEKGFDVEMPGFLSQRDLDRGRLSDIRLTDREVILARSDREEPLELSNVRTGHFVTNLEYPVSGDLTLVVLRGWAAVDVKAEGRAFRFVTTHLEADNEGIREAQAIEVIAGPANTDLPVMLATDANSDANEGSNPASNPTAYRSFINSGFLDPWVQVYSSAEPSRKTESASDLPDPSRSQSVAWRLDGKLLGSTRGRIADLPARPPVIQPIRLVCADGASIRREGTCADGSTPRESSLRGSPITVQPRLAGGPFGVRAIPNCPSGQNFNPFSAACEAPALGASTVAGSVASTCCNAELLTNSSFPVVTDDEGRIDLVLYRGAAAFTPLEIGLLGASAAADRVFNGITEIWTSDHAGVAATFEIRP